jgi:CRISPR-associated endoribonuclease Cas6
MRFRLTLNNPTDNTLIGWNYNYLIMAWIYQKLEAADPDYAAFLHQEGYQSQENSKKFKYMGFSPLHFEKTRGQYTPAGAKGLIIHARQLYLDLSFYMSKAAESFILGVFRDQRMLLYNDRFRAEFQIAQVASLPEPEFSPTMHYAAWAPMLVEQQTKSKKYGDYLPPDHPEFGKLLAINLSDKYFNAIGKRVLPEEIRFELKSSPQTIKSRKISIKENSYEETELKGYLNFDLTLKAPVEVQKCGYYSGFGRYNVQGMGMVRNLL